MRAYSFLAAMFIVLLFSACKDDECDCNEKLAGQWEVNLFISVESTGYPKDDDYSLLIEFKTDGSYSVVLDVNVCSGDYSLGLNDSITIAGAGCTKICCDSEFSKKFMTMLPQISTYTIDGDELRLWVDGWGWIDLNRVSD